MDQNRSQPLNLDLKDVFLYAMKKIFIMLLAGVLLGGFVGGYKLVKILNSDPGTAKSVNVLDISERLSGESDLEYDKRIQLVGRAQIIMANMESMYSQSENLRNYISDSLLMQLDPMNVAVSEVQIIIELDENESAGMVDALINSYAGVVQSGAYIDVIADQYGYEPGSLQELITTDHNDAYILNDDSVMVVLDKNDAWVGSLTITVWGDSTELTEAVLDSAINEIYESYGEYDSSVAKHTITETGKQSYVSFVSDVRELQLDTMTTYQTLQSQIDSGNKSLDDIAKQLGLTDRNSFYADATASQSSKKETVGSAIKYAVMGVVLGAVLVFAFYVCKYIFGRKIVSQSQFFCLFPDCRNIGILKPAGKRSKYLKALDRFSGDDTVLTEDKVDALISANLSNMTKDMGNVLLTGTVSEETAKKISEGLKLTSDVKVDFFNNPEILKNASKYDGVVVLEQRGVSEKKNVMKELEMLRNGVKTIIGVIIV